MTKVTRAALITLGPSALLYIENTDLTRVVTINFWMEKWGFSGENDTKRRGNGATRGRAAPGSNPKLMSDPPYEK